MKKRNNQLCAALIALVLLVSMIPAAAAAQTFVDVVAGDWYAQPVYWAVDNGITNGTSANTFSPGETCTRAQILTFLWRAAGQVQPMIFNPFYDVNAGDYYYEAAIWAYENGLVEGAAFLGGTPCTRADVVTYLWKLEGCPYMAPAAFSDVPAGAYYAQAVAWAVSSGITNGTAPGLFTPGGICTRGQIVTFLHRAFTMVQSPQPPAEEWHEPVYGGSLSEAYVLDVINSMRYSYPEGMVWSLDNSYHSDALNIMGAGCAGFALLCSDMAFGDLPITAEHSDFHAIKVGDMVKTDYGRHTVVVLEKRADSIVVTEGNYNGLIHWDREFYRAELEAGNFTVTTRYPY